MAAKLVSDTANQAVARTGLPARAALSGVLLAIALTG
jgi:hypothetical protein